MLALGALAPTPPVVLPDDPRVVADPWAEGAGARAAPAATTLLVGSGLTAVDVALSACAGGERARVVAISRGGCLPFDHLPGLREPAPAPALPGAPATVAWPSAWLRRHVRDAAAAGHDWRDAIDGLRPLVPRLWRMLPLDERRRFVDERARAWELRRHRMAPEVAADVRALLAGGRLIVRAGRVVGVRARAETVEVLVAAGGELRTLRADRVVVCAGPGRTCAAPARRWCAHCWPAAWRAQTPSRSDCARRRPVACAPPTAGPSRRSTCSGRCVAASCGRRPRCARSEPRRGRSRRRSAPLRRARRSPESVALSGARRVCGVRRGHRGRERRQT